MNEPKSRAAAMEKQFGSVAELYAHSEHKDVPDLDLLRRWASPTGAEIALDIATGAGHTALYFAPLVRRVVVSDLTRGMVSKARERFGTMKIDNADFALADVQSLPFAGASFDLVTSRIAPHHFLDIRGALAEIARVLRKGGLFLLVDSLSPDDDEADAFLDLVERLRDPTHVRAHRRGEWMEMCETAGMRVEHTDAVRKQRNFESWLDRGGADAATAAKVRRCFREASDSIGREFEIVVRDGRVESFTDDKIVLSARRR